MKLNLKLGDKETELIRNFALDNHKNLNYFRPNGYSRQYCLVQNIEGVIKDLCHTIRQEK